MKTDFAFWDTSAIIPLCVRQDTTTQARRVGRRFLKRVIWTGSRVEVYSAISRLKRTSTIDAKGYKVAAKQWEKFLDPAHEVNEIGKLISIAETLPAAYGIRTLDAFQLAAALVWCKEKPRNRPFICADHRLGEAASDAGFDVVSLV